MPPPVLFITRKYPPSIGGMQEFSRGLVHAYPGPRNLVALGGPQQQLPLFLGRALARARKMRGRVSLVHLGDGMIGAFAPLIARLAEAPVVVTLHGREILRDPPGYRLAIRRGLAARGVRCVAVSRDTAHHAQTLLGIDAQVIHNGVRRPDAPQMNGAASPNEAARSALGLPERARIVATLGRLERRKGQAWFAREVVPLLPPDVIYVIAGDGPHRDEVTPVLADRVRWLGALPASQVSTFYAAADLVVAPNIRVPGDSEGYGIAPAEAASAGVPVLVSALDGLVDMAEDFGLRTVAAGDPRAWGDAVLSAFDDPPFATTFRGWEEVAADYARLFTAIVAGRNQARDCTASQE